MQPYFTKLLLEQKLDPEDYQFLVRSFAQNEMVARYEKELAKIIEQGCIEDFVWIIGAGRTKGLVEIMKAKQTEEIIKIIKAEHTEELFRIIQAGHTDKLIENMRAEQTEELIEIFNSPEFETSYEGYDGYLDKSEFRKELLTTMELPKKLG